MGSSPKLVITIGALHVVHQSVRETSPGVTEMIANFSMTSQGSVTTLLIGAASLACSRGRKLFVNTFGCRITNLLVKINLHVSWLIDSCPKWSSEQQNAHKGYTSIKQSLSVFVLW